MRRLFAAGMIVIGLAGCMSSPKPPSNNLNSEQTAKNLSEGLPKPASIDGVKAAPVVADTVRVEPEKAVGYQDLPTSITQLYTQTPMQLGMADVVIDTLNNNRGIKISGYTLRIAEYNVPISRSIYDLFITGNGQVQKTDEQSLTGGTSTERSNSGAISLAQLIPTGATVSAGYMAFMNSFPFSASSVVAGPEFVAGQPFPVISQNGKLKSYTQDATIGITQPLLRGFGPTVTNAGIVIAQLERQGAAADFQTGLENTITNSLTTYWLLIGAIEVYKVRIISYAAALDLLRVNTAKEQAGVLARVDVVQAEAAAEDRREQLIVARQDVRDLEDQLKRQIFLGPNEPQWPVQIQPTQAFAWRDMSIDQDETIKLALAERSELRRARSNIEQSKVNERVARNAMLPELNVFANGGLTGTDRDFSGSGSNLRDADNNNYTAGVSFAYPLQNRAARYRYAQAQVRTAQAGESFSDETDQITLEVRRSVRNVRTARERIDVTSAAVRAQERKVQDTRLRYEVGAATAFEILTFQEDLANSQVQHLQAVIDYNIACIQLERSRGTLLKTFGVEVKDPNLKPKAPPVKFPIGLN